MKKILCSIIMIFGFITLASAAEIGVLGSYNYDSDRLSPGLSLGTKFNTKLGDFGIGYVFLDTRPNNKTTHVHAVTLSKDLYQNGAFGLGFRAGQSYLIRESNTNGMIHIYGPYASLKLNQDFRLIFDLLRADGYGEMKAIDATLVQVGLRYKF